MQKIDGQIAWVYTDALKTGVTFYRDTLGLKVARDAGSAMIFETGPGAFLGICEVFGDRVVEPKGGMITILTDDVDGWYAKLKTKGVVLQGAPQRLEKFGIYSFFCVDPNGYIIEFQCFVD